MSGVAAPDEDALHGRWVHSHEEDTDGERVYRPADYPFPPARGREALELRADGTYAQTAPGPVDVPVEGLPGRWSLDGDRLELGPAGGLAGRALEIAGVSRNRLVVRR